MQYFSFMYKFNSYAGIYWKERNKICFAIGEYKIVSFNWYDEFFSFVMFGSQHSTCLYFIRPLKSANIECFYKLDQALSKVSYVGSDTFYFVGVFRKKSGLIETKFRNAAKVKSPGTNRHDLSKPKDWGGHLKHTPTNTLYLHEALDRNIHLTAAVDGFVHTNNTASLIRGALKLLFILPFFPQTEDAAQTIYHYGCPRKQTGWQQCKSDKDYFPTCAWNMRYATFLYRSYMRLLVWSFEKIVL